MSDVHVPRCRRRPFHRSCCQARWTVRRSCCAALAECVLVPVAVFVSVVGNRSSDGDPLLRCSPRPSWRARNSCYNAARGLVRIPVSAAFVSCTRCTAGYIVRTQARLTCGSRVALLWGADGNAQGTVLGCELACRPGASLRAVM